MPPPRDVAWFFLILLEKTFRVALFSTPPPAPLAELPLTVQLVRVAVLPAKFFTPPPPPTPLAELPLTVQR